MDEIAEKLKKRFSENSTLKCSGKSWNTSTKQNDLWTSRKNITDDNKEYKYLEITTWDLSKDICIAIGHNPAIASVDDIDDTNNKLLNKLKDRYGGYILLNLYPRVTKDVDSFGEPQREDIDYKSLLKDIISDVISNEIDVIVFWGRSVEIDDDFGNVINKLLDNDRLYITVKENTTEHYHPARVNISLIKATRTSLKKSWRIV